MSEVKEACEQRTWMNQYDQKLGKIEKEARLSASKDGGKTWVL